MRRSNVKINFQRKGQTILELSLVVFSLLGFFFLGLFSFSIFEVSQKQTLLTRAQAFIELGNHSSYGRAEHGKDDPKDAKSQVYFQLGKKSPGIFRVDFDKVETFKEAVEGELDLTAGAQTEDVFWSKYRFPKRLTRLFGGENRGELDSVELEMYLAIAHNRSIDLEKENSANETGEYSTGVHFQKINAPLAQSIQKALSESYGAELPSMISNYDETLALLKELVKEDSSVHKEAEALENDMNVWRAIAGQAQAALVALAIQTALSFGFEALGNLLGSGGAAAGSAAEAGASTAVSSGGNALTAFGQGATDLASFFTTTSHVLSVAHSASALAGNPLQGLSMASTVTGGLGSVFQGLAGLDGFNVDGGFSGAGLKSDFFNSSGSILGGTSRITSLVDPSAAKAFGIASQGMGFAGSVSGLGENWGTWSTQDGGMWKQSSALGQTISQGAGLLSHAAPGSAAVGAIGLVGSAFSTAGGIGTFSADMAAGKYDGKTFDVMSQTGGLMAQTSGLAMNMMSITGNTSAMNGLAIAAIAGGSLAAAGAAGNLAEGVIRDAPTWGQKISDGVDSVLSGEAFEGAFDGMKLASSEGAWDREVFHQNMDAISNAAQAIDMGLKMASVAKAGAEGAGAAVAALPGLPTGVPSSVTAGTAASAQNLEAGVTQVAAAGGATPMMENILSEIDPAQVIAATNMSSKEAADFQKDFLAVKRSISEIKKSYDKKEIPDEEMLKKARAAATRLQETLDKHSQAKDGADKKDKSRKEKLDLADAAEENMNLHRYYQARYEQHFRIVGYTQTSENHLMGKTIVAKGSDKREFLRDYGKKVSKEIQSYRELNFLEDDPAALRLKRAEYHWRNLNFISPKEALDLMRAQYLNQKRGFEDLKTRFQNQLQACGLAEAC